MRLKSRFQQRGMADVIPTGLLVMIYGGGALLVLAIISSLLAPIFLLKRKWVLGITLCSVVFFWWRILYYPDMARTAVHVAREKAIAVCNVELAGIPSEIEIDSLAIDPGIVDSNVLDALIGERKLRFVELKARARDPRPGDNGGWGPSIVSGDQTSGHNVPTNMNFVKYFLAPASDPNCVDNSLSTSSDAPFSPDACWSVVPTEKSEASHVLKHITSGEHSDFGKWAIVEQRSGNVVAALTSSDGETSPVRQGGGDEYRVVQRGIVSCRQPFFDLPNLLYSNSLKDSRLSLSKRTVTPERSPDDEANPENWPELAVEEVPVPDWSTSKYDSVRVGMWGPAWRNAYRLAAQTGWASVGESVINFKTGTLVSLEKPSIGGKRGEGYTVASEDGFIFVSHWYLGKQGLPFVRYSPEGKVVSRGFLISRAEHPENIGRFDPVAVEWDGSELHVYGFRRNSSTQTTDVSVLKLTLESFGSHTTQHKALLEDMGSPVP